MDNCDLLSEEARNAITKYKVYKPKPSTVNASPTIVRDIKTTAMIAREGEFKAKYTK